MTVEDCATSFTTTGPAWSSGQGDVDSLTVAAQRLLGDPALCTRIAAEALGRSRDDLSIERRADSFATTYRALLRDAGRRRRISRFDSNGQG